MQDLHSPVSLSSLSSPSTRKPVTLPATVIVTTVPSPLRPALLLVGLAESQSTLAPSRTRPTHTLLQIALQIRCLGFQP